MARTGHRRGSANDRPEEGGATARANFRRKHGGAWLYINVARALGAGVRRAGDAMDVPADTGAMRYKAALDERVAHAYDELCAVARRLMARERAGHALGAAALVHEAYVRLFDQRNLDPADGGRFLAAAATTMRRVLVDHAKRRRAAKRGGAGWRCAGDADAVPDDAPGPACSVDLLALDEALAKLARAHPRAAAVVSLRYTAGLSVREVAAALRLAPRTVREDWARARAWLRHELHDEGLAHGGDRDRSHGQGRSTPGGP